VHAVCVVVPILFAHDVAATVSGHLAVMGRIGASDNRPFDLLGESVVGGAGHGHGRVSLAVFGIVAGTFIVVPAVEFLTLQLWVHSDSSAMDLMPPTSGHPTSCRARRIWTIMLRLLFV
jgi:hypothetical protein